MHTFGCSRNKILGLSLIFVCSMITACSDSNPAPPKDGVPTSSIATDLPDEKQDEDTKMREIAWSSLTTRQQDSVQGNWQEAKVEKVEGDSIRYGIAMDKRDTEMPDQAILVTFHTIQDSMLGPLVVYIDADTQKRVGIGVRE